MRPARQRRGVQLARLRHLADRLGPDLVAGIVLHTGTQTLPFGPRMRAMPLSSLWEMGSLWEMAAHSTAE